MSIKKEITLKWSGDEYPLLITMDLIARIENDINLVAFVADVASNNMKASRAAFFASRLLQEAGADVSVDDCYLAFIGEGGAQKTKEVSEIISEGLNAAFPISKKKPGAETKKPPKKKSKATAKNSTAS